MKDPFCQFISTTIREKHIHNFTERVNIKTTEPIKNTADKLGMHT